MSNEINNTSFNKICRCSECYNWRNSCQLGYRVFANSKPCKHGLKRPHDHQKTLQTMSSALFFQIGELERSSSGRTVKLYLFEAGKRCFIGQVTCSSLRELINGQSLKAGICKYQNAGSEAPTQ